MSKRILSLLVCFVMILTCFVGCKKDTDEAMSDTQEEASKATHTVAMHLMSEEEVSEEQAAAIQDAVNKITKSKFKTQLVLHFYTEDEYYTALEKAYADKENAGEVEQDNSNAAKDEEEEATEEETYVDEYGVAQLKYPTIPDYQVDIFYLGGYDRLMQYMENDMVADLSEEVSSASKKLATFLSPGYLEGMDSICEGVYAIPANEPIGEYTYMLLNKDMLNKYNHVASDFNSLFDSNTKALLEIVSKYEKSYLPLRSFTPSGELDITHMRYFGINENGYFDDKTFSLLGGSYDPSWTYMTPNQFSSCANIFNSAEFASKMKDLIAYRANGYYGTEADASKDFAVGYIKGGPEVIRQYTDKYEVVVLEKPTIGSMDIFNNMFAVSSFSTDLARSMEIVTYLYTNADFRNLLLYGIEGTNYELVETEMEDANGDPYKVVKRLNNNYMMAPEKTGNVLLAIPTEDQAPNLRELYKQQNLDSSISLVMGITHKYGGVQISTTHMDYLREQSKIVLDKLMTLKTAEEYETYSAEMKVYLREDKTLAEATRSSTIKNPDDPEGEPLHNLCSIYNQWIDDNKLNPGDGT